MSDNLTVFGIDYTGVTGIKAKGTGNGTLTYIRPQGTKSISANGTGIDVTQYASVDVAVPTPTPSLQSKSATPTESAQTITADHAIVVAYASSGPELYVKLNGSWVKVTKAYRKANGTWSEVSLDEAFSSGGKYVRA